MDEAAKYVSAIRLKLAVSRKKLHEHDQLNERVFKSKGRGIQTALRSADHKIVDVHVKISTFVRQLECIEKASRTVNLQPQMSWVFDEFGAIDQDLVSAYQHADSAVVFSDEQGYKIMDIKEQFEVESNNLKNHNATVQRLLATAKKQIDENKKKIEEANSSIFSNETDIQEHQTSIKEIELKISQLQKNISSKESEKYKANENRKDARNTAIATGVVTGISVALIAFTFGLSGVVGGFAAGGMAVSIDKAIDYKRDVKRLQDSISGLNSEKSTLVSAVSGLNLQNAAMTRDVERFRQEIEEKQAEAISLEVQIRDGGKTRKKITSVESHAASTLTTVEGPLLELRNVRNNLEKFSDLVKERSIEVEASADLTYKVMKHIPIVGTKLKRKRNFEADIPSLLPLNVKKALDIKPWNSATVSVIEVGKSIPSIVMF